MPLPRSLTAPIRQSQLQVGSGWRAYFAPFNQALAVNQGSNSLGPSIYDLEVFAKFLDLAQAGTYLPYSGTNQSYRTGSATPFAPPGWLDLGYVKNFKFTPGSKTGNVMTGYRGAIRAKYRAETGEKFTCQFMEVSRTTLRITTGSQVFNILTTSQLSPSTVGPLSTSGITATAIGASGYQPTGIVATATAGLPTLFVPSGSGFAVNDMIVCDQDYVAGTYGFIGDAGANVFQGAVTDVDFIRKTSDYVQSVQQVITGVAGQDALVLAGPFAGGGNQGSSTIAPNYGPTAGAKVQKISGFTAREGGTYIAEWSAMFVLDTINTSQVMFYYPRVAPDTFTGFTDENLQGATSMQTSALTSGFDALAYDDPLDGETVVAYRAFFPAPGQSIGI